MVLFESMQSIILWTIVTSIILIWFCSGKQPLAVFNTFIRFLVCSRLFLLTFSTMVFILCLNSMELAIENKIQIHWNFTSMIYQWEGSFVSNIQQLFYHPVITQMVSFFYLVVFQSLIITSLCIYITYEDKRFVHAVCYAIMMNYIVAIPFYLFFPVDEVWSYAPARVHFVMLEIFPHFEEQYRACSGINNCFPSLHTSISMTMALLAAKSGNTVWAMFTAASAIIIVFSIFYLGIHWLTDMVAGVILALSSATLGMKLATKLLPYR